MEPRNRQSTGHRLPTTLQDRADDRGRILAGDRGLLFARASADIDAKHTERACQSLDPAGFGMSCCAAFATFSIAPAEGDDIVCRSTPCTFSTVRIVPSPSSPIVRLMSVALSSAGKAGPENIAEIQVKNGAIRNVQANATPHTQPMNGRQPATNTSTGTFPAMPPSDSAERVRGIGAPRLTTLAATFVAIHRSSGFPKLAISRGCFLLAFLTPVH